MRTIADHIYDIASNSIKAKSSNIHLKIIIQNNKFIFKIQDNGSGINEEILKNIFDPFITSRNKKIRKVGLGLPLLKQNTELTGGYVVIDSKFGEGTYLEAQFLTNSIDMIEIGDIAGTITGLITAEISIDWEIELTSDTTSERLTTIELKNILGDIPLNNIQVIPIIKNIIQDICSTVFENV